LSEFVSTACEMIFLLNKRHCPYYKWSFRALRGVDVLSELASPLEYLLTSDNDEKGVRVKKEMIEDIALAIAGELKRQGVADCDGSYLEPYGFAAQNKIKSAELRNMHILIG